MMNFGTDSRFFFRSSGKRLTVFDAYKKPSRQVGRLKSTIAFTCLVRQSISPLRSEFPIFVIHVACNQDGMCRRRLERGILEFDLSLQP
jgi:hypothetical protein